MRGGVGPDLRRVKNPQPLPLVLAWRLPPPPALLGAPDRSELIDVRLRTAARRLAEAAAAEERRACARGAGGGRLALLRRACGAMRLPAIDQRTVKGKEKRDKDELWTCFTHTVKTVPGCEPVLQYIAQSVTLLICELGRQ